MNITDNKLLLQIFNQNKEIIAQNKKITELCDDLYTSIDELESKYDFLCDKINNVYDSVEDLKKMKTMTIKVEDKKELKPEKMDIDKEYVIKMMTYKDHRTLIKIIQKYYGENNYPFKYKQGNGFDYFTNDRWIHDTYGVIIIDILFNNLKCLLYKANIVDNFKLSQIIDNQNFICLLSTEKFKRTFIKYFKNMLLTNK